MPVPLNKVNLGKLICLALAFAAYGGAQTDVGIFEGHGDVGAVLHPGAMEFEQAPKSYTVTASGENLWGTADAFHFAWKKMSGDVSITADISFPAQGGDPHKKAVLMIRQSLDADSAYADVAVHGSGLTSLQSRDARGVATHEIQSDISAPGRVRLEKLGNYFYVYVGGKGGATNFMGGAMRVSLEGPFYVGIGVSAHNKDAVEKANFSDVAIQSLSMGSGEPTQYSTLETITVASTDRRVSYLSPRFIQAPNWSLDGKSLLFTLSGTLNHVPVEGGKPKVINVGNIEVTANHGLSPDGITLAFSGESVDQGTAIYTVPAMGGTPKLVTKNSPCYFHGWSPDGMKIIFSSRRDGHADIYTIPAAGGEETRLTSNVGVNGTPEFSPDGKSIYFQSNRTGTNQIWRMSVDGTNPEQVTTGDMNDFFPHISPDGKRLVFLSYDKGVVGHPENKEVVLRMLALDTQKTTVLAKFLGGQGSIDAPSWSPDSKHVAFVSYQMIPQSK